MIICFIGGLLLSGVVLLLLVCFIVGVLSDLWEDFH